MAVTTWKPSQRRLLELFILATPGIGNRLKSQTRALVAEVQDVTRNLITALIPRSPRRKMQMSLRLNFMTNAFAFCDRRQNTNAYNNETPRRDLQITELCRTPLFPATLMKEFHLKNPPFIITTTIANSRYYSSLKRWRTPINYHISDSVSTVCAWQYFVNSPNYANHTTPPLQFAACPALLHPIEMSLHRLTPLTVVCGDCETFQLAIYSLLRPRFHSPHTYTSKNASIAQCCNPTTPSV